MEMLVVELVANSAVVCIILCFEHAEHFHI